MHNIGARGSPQRRRVRVHGRRSPPGRRRQATQRSRVPALRSREPPHRFLEPHGPPRDTTIACRVNALPRWEPALAPRGVPLAPRGPALDPRWTNMPSGMPYNGSRLHNIDAREPPHESRRPPHQSPQPPRDYAFTAYANQLPPGEPGMKTITFGARTDEPTALALESSVAHCLRVSPIVDSGVADRAGSSEFRVRSLR